MNKRQVAEFSARITMRNIVNAVNDAAVLAPIYGESAVDWVLGTEAGEVRTWLTWTRQGWVQRKEVVGQHNLVIPDQDLLARPNGWVGEERLREDDLTGEYVPQADPKTCSGCAMKRRTEDGKFRCLAGHRFTSGWDAVIPVDKDGEVRLTSSGSAGAKLAKLIEEGDQAAVWSFSVLLGSDDWIDGLFLELEAIGWTPPIDGWARREGAVDEDVLSAARAHLTRIHAYPARVSANAWEEWVAKRPAPDGGYDEVESPSADDRATDKVRNVRRSTCLNGFGACRDKVKWSSYWSWFFAFDGEPWSYKMDPARTYCVLGPDGKGVRAPGTTRVSLNGWAAWKTATAVAFHDGIVDNLIPSIAALLRKTQAPENVTTTVLGALHEAAFSENPVEQALINKGLVDFFARLLIAHDNPVVRQILDRLCGFYRFRQRVNARPGKPAGSWYKLWFRAAGTTDSLTLSPNDFGRVVGGQLVEWKTKAGRPTLRRHYRLVNRRLAAMQAGEAAGHILFYPERSGDDVVVIG